MKNKKCKIIILLLLIPLLLTGCTKYMSDTDNKKVINEVTGQSLPSNILCKPTDKEILNIYQSNEKQMAVKLDKLPACKNFAPNKIKYTGLWEELLIKPLAYIIIIVGNLVNNYGLSVMILGFVFRAVLYPLSKKTTMQSENMKKAQPEIQKLEKKYENKNDRDSMMMKSQETMAIYKKYDVKPMAGCIVAFIQLPLFLAFLEAINRVPAIFEGKLFGMSLGMTPLMGIKAGNYIFIILLLAIMATTYFSLINTMNSAAGGQNQKQSKFMGYFMLVIITIASVNLPTAIGLYWIVTNAFTVLQNFLVKKRRS